MLLEVKDLCLTDREKERQLLSGLSFSLDAGESMVVLGMSGSGKSMLCASLLQSPSKKRFALEGQIDFHGESLTGLSERKRRKLYGNRIVFIPQNPMTAFDPSMRIGKQMTEVLYAHRLCTRRLLGRREARETVMTALKNAGLTDLERVFASRSFQLSGGMLQRVLIAFALMTKAELVIADEPTAALDAQLRKEVIASLNGLKEKGCAVLMTTHDLFCAGQLGGKAMLLSEGRSVRQGETQDVLAYWGRECSLVRESGEEKSRAVPEGGTSCQT